MGYSQKRPYEVVDLTGDDDDDSPRLFAKLPRVGASSAGLPSHIAKQGRQHSSSQASQSTQRSRPSQTATDDGESEVLDLTQNNDGPAYDLYGCLSMSHLPLPCE